MVVESVSNVFGLCTCIVRDSRAISKHHQHDQTEFSPKLKIQRWETACLPVLRCSAKHVFQLAPWTSKTVRTHFVTEVENLKLLGRVGTTRWNGIRVGFMVISMRAGGTRQEVCGSCWSFPHPTACRSFPLPACGSFPLQVITSVRIVQLMFCTEAGQVQNLLLCVGKRFPKAQHLRLQVSDSRLVHRIAIKIFFQLLNGLIKTIGRVARTVKTPSQKVAVWVYSIAFVGLVAQGPRPHRWLESSQCCRISSLT